VAVGVDPDALDAVFAGVGPVPVVTAVVVAGVEPVVAAPPPKLLLQ